MKKISYKTFPLERDLYNLKNAYVFKCKFEGKEDGESALKEARNIVVDECEFSLRYPLWHVKKFELKNSLFNDTSRAPMWYTRHASIFNTKIFSVKAIRECYDTHIENCHFESEEFGWKCKRIFVKDSYIESPYLFLDSKDIEIDNLTFKGKYSFQYVKNVEIKNSNFDTKDAFWHSKNVTVKDSVIKGEYLGWFSDSLTLINCKIIGTQPLCYCKNLKLVNCEMIDSDLSFEYSEVDATIKGHVLSIKNPKSGQIIVDSLGELISEDSIMKSTAKVIVKNKAN